LGDVKMKFTLLK